MNEQPSDSPKNLNRPAAPTGAFGLGLACPLVLAPLAELTHAPFRMLVRELGGCDLFCTEMLSAAALVRGNPRDSIFLIRDPAETNLVHQLMGAEPAVMGDAAAVLESRGAVWLDLNMGCSAPLIKGRGQGVALMREPDRAGAIAAEVRRRFGGHLSVKIRLGWAEETDRLPRFCRTLRAAGVQTLTVHARFQHEKFKGRARWEWLPRVREWFGGPVVGNGDVFLPADAGRLRQAGGSDGIMIGRGAAIRPWLFREIAGAAGPAPPPERLLLRFIGLLRHYLPPERHLSRLKIFLYWFKQSLPFGHTLWARVQATATLEQAEERIREFFTQSPDG